MSREHDTSNWATKERSARRKAMISKLREDLAKAEAALAAEKQDKQLQVEALGEALDELHKQYLSREGDHVDEMREAKEEIDRLKAEQGYDRTAAIEAALVESREREAGLREALKKV